MASRLLTLTALAALCAIGGYGAMGLSARNGFFDTIGPAVESELDPKSPLSASVGVPGCPTPFKRVFTRVPPADYLLASQNGFFCGIWDGGDAVAWDIFIGVLYGMVQFGLGWPLLALEGVRGGNKGRAVARIAIFGMIIQNISYTVAVPLYLILHVLTSPISSTTKPNANLIAAAPSDLAAVLPSVFIAYLIPTILMALPSPQFFSAATRYNLIAFWQYFPIWYTLTHALLSSLGGSSASSPSTPSTTSKATLVNLRTIYQTIIILGTITHLSLIAVALTPASAPGLPQAWQTIFASVTSARDVLVPRWYPDTPVMDVTSGSPLAPLAFSFLQYDMFCGNMAIAVWAAYLLGKTDLGAGVLLYTLVKAVVAGLVGGPAVAAAVLLWARDERVLLKAGAEKKRL